MAETHAGGLKIGTFLSREDRGLLKFLRRATFVAGGTGETSAARRRRGRRHHVVCSEAQQQLQLSQSAWFRAHVLFVKIDRAAGELMKPIFLSARGHRKRFLNIMATAPTSRTLAKPYGSWAYDRSAPGMGMSDAMAKSSFSTSPG